MAAQQSNDANLTKLAYTVISCSSSDPSYPSSSLNTNHQSTSQSSSSTKGWQSARLSPMPQSLILHFTDGIVDVKKIQILSHQSKIAASIQLFSGNVINQQASNDPSSSLSIKESDLSFTRLGFLSLDSNERSEYRARELKSVYVTARGAYLKLLIDRCHSNDLNVYNQIGLIGVNCVGSVCTPQQLAQHTNDSALDPTTSAALQKFETLKRNAIEIEDFDEAKRLKQMIDNLNSVVQQIKELEKQKRKAVADEDFDAAKHCKQQIDQLRADAISGNTNQPQHPQQQSNRRTRPPTQQRSQAHHQTGGAPHLDPEAPLVVQPVIENDNQQQSSHSHQAYDEQPIRSKHTLNQHAQSSKADTAQHLDAYLQESPQHAKRSTHVARDTSSGPSSHRSNEPQYDERPLPGQKGNKKPTSSDSHHSSSAAVGEMIDERPLKPAASQKSFAPLHSNDTSPKASHVQRQMDEYPPNDENAESSEIGANGELPQPEPIRAVNRKEADALRDCYSQHTIQSLFSKHWQLRVSALKHIEQLTQSHATDPGLAESDGSAPPPPDSKRTFNGLCRILKNALTDKVSQVFACAMSLLNTVLDSIPSSQLRADEVRSGLDSVGSAMLDRIGASVARDRESGKHVLSVLAFHRSVSNALIPQLLLAPLKKREVDAPIPIKSRATLLLKLVLRFGCSDALGLSSNALVAFALPHVSHRDVDVRQSVLTLLAVIARLIGRSKLETYVKDVKPVQLDALDSRIVDIASGKIDVASEVSKSEGGPRAWTEALKRPAEPAPERLQSHSAANTSAIAPASSSKADVTPRREKAAGGGAAAGASQRKSVSKNQAAPASSAAKKSSSKNASPRETGKPKAGGKQSATKQQQSTKAQAQAAQASSPAVDDGYEESRFSVHHTTDLTSPVKDDPASPASDTQPIDVLGKCQFCSLENPSWAEEDLDLHYWSDCPMLISCSQCEQVIEIPTLTEHFLNECEQSLLVSPTSGAPLPKIEWRQCPSCQQLFNDPKEYTHHVHELMDCKPLETGKARCALCNSIVTQGDAGFKAHLLDKGCPKNPRKVKR